MKRRNVFSKTLPLAMVFAGIVGVCTGMQLLPEKAAVPQPKNAKGVTVAPQASSKPPSPEAVVTYSVAADLPKYISIPVIGLGQTRVRSLGLQKNNSIVTPNNIHDAGWYNASAKPGQSGAMFIFGHVSGPDAHGAFYDLKKLRPGNKVTIIRGDDTAYTYVVQRSQLYATNEVDMNAVLAPVNPAVSGLNLMTCDGMYDPKSQAFSKRLVVFMSLMP